MFTPCNVYPACLLGRSDRIGRARLDLVNRGHVIPLGLSSEFRIPSSEFGNAPCSMHHACYSTGARPFFKQVSHKAPLTHNEGGAFLFCLPRGIKSIFHRGTHYFTGGILWGKDYESVREGFVNSNSLPHLLIMTKSQEQI